MIHQQTLEFLRTRGRGTQEVTAELQRAVAACGIRTGVATVFLQHTSASLVLCENADPDVRFFCFHGKTRNACRHACLPRPCHVFRELTEKEDASLKSKSPKLFTLAALYDANRELLRGTRDKRHQGPRCDGRRLRAMGVRLQAKGRQPTVGSTCWAAYGMGTGGGILDTRGLHL